MEEIGDIGWFNYKECRELIRPYHYERQKILNETYIFLSSIIDNKFNNKLTITNKVEDENISDSNSNSDSDSISMDDNLIEDDIFIFDKV